MRRSSLALVLLLGCSIRRAEPPGNNPEEDLLRASVAACYREMSARDWPAYRARFWPQATLTTVWQPPGEPRPRVVVTTIESFLAHTAQGPDSKRIFEERLLGQEVRVTGNLAQVWARYEARFGDPGNVAVWRGIDAFTWMKHDGTWRITGLAYTDEPATPRGAP
jgi:hypothetical protein